jgi:L-asparagine transporter-like permease
VRPTLGDAGFAAMAVAALLATASSVTATLYASEGLTTALAEVGQFPTVFGTGSRLGRHGGLWITTVSTLLFVNVFDLGALASIGSAVSLAVFVLVGVAAIRLRRTIGAHLPVLLAGVLFSVVVLVVFAVDTYSNDKKAFWTMILLPVLALALDAGWKNRSKSAARSTPR